MKTQVTKTVAASVISLGLFAAAGCTNSPLRQSTESSETPAVLHFAGLVPPAPLRSVQPFYPLEMKVRGISGVVHLTCLVTESGEVRDPVLVSASDEAFVQPALAAVKKWSFKPARRDGVPVAMRVNLPIRFTLTD